MSSGSRTLNQVIPTSNTNFSGTSYGTSTCQFVDSWNFPSPRIKPKGLPPTPGNMSMRRDSMNIGTRTIGGGLTKNVRTGPPRYLMATNFVQRIDSYDSSSDANASVSQALSRFSTGDVNLGNFLGELKSSFAMVVKRLGSIRGMASSLKKADFRDIENSSAFSNYPKSKRDWDSYKGKMKNLPPSKRVASGWLELQFGWLPLLSDIWNASDAIRESYRGKGSVVTSRSTRFRTGKGLKAQSGVWGQVSNPGLRSLSELGLLNPLSVAWELTPFSFVLDYFAKIGELLNASQFNVGMENVLVWKIYETESVTYRSGTTGSSAYPEIELSRIKYAFRVVTPASTPKIPRLVLPNLNATQVSTSIALLVQLMRSK